MEEVDRFINETYKGIEEWDQPGLSDQLLAKTAGAVNPLQAPVRLRKSDVNRLQGSGVNGTLHSSLNVSSNRGKGGNGSRRGVTTTNMKMELMDKLIKSREEKERQRTISAGEGDVGNTHGTEAGVVDGGLVDAVDLKIENGYDGFVVLASSIDVSEQVLESQDLVLGGRRGGLRSDGANDGEDQRYEPIAMDHESVHCEGVDIDDIAGLQVACRASEGDSRRVKGGQLKSTSCSRSQKFESRNGARFHQFPSQENDLVGLSFQQPVNEGRTRPQTSLQSLDAKFQTRSRRIGITPSVVGPVRAGHSTRYSNLNLNFESMSQAKRANALSMYIPRGQRSQIGVNMIQRLLRNAYQNPDCNSSTTDDGGQGLILRAANDLKPNVESRLVISSQNLDNQLRYSKRVASSGGARNLTRPLGSALSTSMGTQRYKLAGKISSYQFSNPARRVLPSSSDAQGLHLASEQTMQTTIVDGEMKDKMSMTQPMWTGARQPAVAGFNAGPSERDQPAATPGGQSPLLFPSSNLSRRSRGSRASHASRGRGELNSSADFAQAQRPRQQFLESANNYGHRKRNFEWQSGATGFGNITVDGAELSPEATQAYGGPSRNAPVPARMKTAGADGPARTLPNQVRRGGDFNYFVHRPAPSRGDASTGRPNQTGHPNQVPRATEIALILDSQELQQPQYQLPASPSAPWQISKRPNASTVSNSLLFDPGAEITFGPSGPKAEAMPAELAGVAALSRTLAQGKAGQSYKKKNMRMGKSPIKKQMENVINRLDQQRRISHAVTGGPASLQIRAITPPRIDQQLRVQAELRTRLVQNSEAANVLKRIEKAEHEAKKKQQQLQELNEELARLRESTRQSVNLHVFEQVWEWRKTMTPDLDNRSNTASGQYIDPRLSMFDNKDLKEISSKHSRKVSFEDKYTPFQSKKTGNHSISPGHGKQENQIQFEARGYSGKQTKSQVVARTQAMMTSKQLAVLKNKLQDQLEEMDKKVEHEDFLAAQYQLVVKREEHEIQAQKLKTQEQYGPDSTNGNFWNQLLQNSAGFEKIHRLEKTRQSTASDLKKQRLNEEKQRAKLMELELGRRVATLIKERKTRQQRESELAHNDERMVRKLNEVKEAARQRQASRDEVIASIDSRMLEIKMVRQIQVMQVLQKTMNQIESDGDQSYNQRLLRQLKELSSDVQEKIVRLKIEPDDKDTPIQLNPIRNKEDSPTAKKLPTRRGAPRNATGQAASSTSLTASKLLQPQARQAVIDPEQRLQECHEQSEQVHLIWNQINQESTGQSEISKAMDFKSIEKRIEGQRSLLESLTARKVEIIEANHQSLKLFGKLDKEHTYLEKIAEPGQKFGAVLDYSDYKQIYPAIGKDSEFEAIITTWNTLKFVENAGIPQKQIYVQELAKNNQSFLAYVYYAVQSLNMRPLIVLSELSRITGTHDALFKLDEENPVFAEDQLEMLWHFEKMMRIKGKKARKGKSSSKGSGALQARGPKSQSNSRMSFGERGSHASVDSQGTAGGKDQAYTTPNKRQEQHNRSALDHTNAPIALDLLEESRVADTSKQPLPLGPDHQPSQTENPGNTPFPAFQLIPKLLNSLRCIMVPAHEAPNAFSIHKGVTLAPGIAQALDDCLNYIQAPFDQEYVSDYVENSPLLKAARPDRTHDQMYNLKSILPKRQAAEGAELVRLEAAKTSVPFRRTPGEELEQDFWDPMTHGLDRTVFGDRKLECVEHDKKPLPKRSKHACKGHSSKQAGHGVGGENEAEAPSAKNKDWRKFKKDTQELRLFEKDELRFMRQYKTNADDRKYAKFDPEQNFQIKDTWGEMLEVRARQRTMTTGLTKHLIQTKNYIARKYKDDRLGNLKRPTSTDWDADPKIRKGFAKDLPDHQRRSSGKNPILGAGKPGNRRATNQSVHFKPGQQARRGSDFRQSTDGFSPKDAGRSPPPKQHRCISSDYVQLTVPQVTKLLVDKYPQLRNIDFDENTKPATFGLSKKK